MSETPDQPTEIKIDADAFAARLLAYHEERKKEASEALTRAFGILGAHPECASVVFVYEGSGDSGDSWFENAEALSEIFSSEELDALRSAAWRSVYQYHAGWENNEGGGGTVTMTTVSFDIEHYDNIVDREYASHKVVNPSHAGVQEFDESSIHEDLIQGANLEDLQRTTDAMDRILLEQMVDGSYDYDSPATIEPSIGTRIQEENERRAEFDSAIMAYLREFLATHNTFLALRCYTPLFNDGLPCENVFSFCRIGPGEDALRYPEAGDAEAEEEDSFSNEDGDGDSSAVVGLSLTAEAEETAEVLCNWVVNNFRAVVRELDLRDETNMTLFIRAGVNGGLEHVDEEYECGF
jgi:hypothetical protein